MTVFRIGAKELPINTSAKGRIGEKPCLTVGLDGTFDAIKQAFENPESIVQVEENGYETDFSAFNTLQNITYENGQFKVTLTQYNEADELKAQLAALTVEKETLQSMVNQYATTGTLDAKTAAVAVEKGLIAEEAVLIK